MPSALPYPEETKNRNTRDAYRIAQSSPSDFGGLQFSKDCSRHMHTVAQFPAVRSVLVSLLFFH